MTNSFSTENHLTETPENNSSACSEEGETSSRESPPSPVAAVSLPSYHNLKDRLDQKRWQGWLRELTSLDTLLDQPGFYPWYKQLSLAMKNKLRGHVRTTMPEGSLERMDDVVRTEAAKHQMKYHRVVKDEDYMVAQARQLDDDSSIVVTVPREDLGFPVSLLALSGASPEQIATTLGISKQTAEKLSREANVYSALSEGLEPEDVRKLASKSLQVLLKQVDKFEDLDPKVLVSILNFCMRFLQGKAKKEEEIEDLPQKAPKFSVRMIAEHHKKLLEKADANFDDE